MKDLEKAMMKQYQYQRLGRSANDNEKELVELQDWAEKWLVQKKGRLTISDENEIKQILDKLRSNQP